MLAQIAPYAALMGLCLGLSAFFSASETALTALDPIQTQKLIDSNNFWSKALELWRNRPMMVLTCMLIGNNIVNISASALSTELAHLLLDGTEYAQTALPLAIGCMTLLLLTFGEITPKTLARSRSRQIAGRMMWLMRIPYVIFFPLTWIFSRMTRALMALTGDTFEEAPQGPRVTEEDIEYLVELGSRGGNLEDRRERILQSAFDFTTTKVREIMIPRIDMIAIDRREDFHEALDKLTASGHSRLPVFDETIDNIVGVFFAKDLLKQLKLKGADGLDFDIDEYIKPAYFVPESKKISDLLSEFQKSRIHMAIVVGEFGGTSGLITLEDIIEEFFGDIQDEHDAEEDYFQILGEGHLLAVGRCPLDEIEDELDVTFPDHPDYDSLGGFILS